MTKNTKRKRKDERPYRSTRFQGSYEETDSSVDFDCNDDLERTSNKRKVLPSEGKLRRHFKKVYFSKEYAKYIKENNKVYPPISWYKDKKNAASVAVPTNQHENNDNNVENTTPRHLTSSSTAPNVDKQTTISSPSTSSTTHFNPIDDEELFTLLQPQPSCMLPFPPVNQLPHGDTMNTASTIKMEEDEVEITGSLHPTLYTANRDIKFCIKHEENKKIFYLQSGSFVSVHYLKNIVTQKFGYIGPLYFLDPDVKMFIEIDEDAVKCIKDLNLVFLSTNPNEKDYSKSN